jgi:hypothetical protein
MVMLYQHYRDETNNPVPKQKKSNIPGGQIFRS